MAARLCVGIDIGASSVKLCQLKARKNGFALEHFGMVPLPPEAVVDGALMNSSRIVDAIQELMAAHKIKNKHVALSISGHSVIIKKIPYPQMNADELEESIQWEAEQYIPFDVQDVNIGHQIVRDADSAQGQMEVVLVAAKKDVINEYTSVIAEAGLEPMVCDVDAFAIENVFETNYEVNEGETVALVNVGASKTTINIVANASPAFTRDLTIGGNVFTEEIQKQMNTTFDEAEAMKLGSSGRSGESDSVVPQEVEVAIQGVAEQITSEVQRSIDFYSATSADPSPAQVYLSGGSARLPALSRALEARIGVPVVVLDPFRQIEVSPHDLEYIRSVGPAAAVAVGLALRFPGDA